MVFAAASCAADGGEQVQASGPDDAGATAGGIVGGVVRANEDGGDDSTTTESTASTDTTAPPDTATTATTAPPPTTQRTTPQTTPQTIITNDTVLKAQPSVVDVGSLNGDERQVFDHVNGLGGPLQLEAGLTNTARSHAGRMASTGSLDGGNILAETGQPWGRVKEFTGNGTDMAVALEFMATNAYGGFNFVGVGVSRGGDGLIYIDIRLARV